MAVRITHTNNSDEHDGTYVFRSTSPMDPQNLPAPIADEPPVAPGATFEYIDSPADGTYYYRTQDHEGGQVSAVSAEVSLQIGFSAQIGDAVEGGIFAGKITYSDGREFHIITATADAELTYPQWKVSATSDTGMSDFDDGVANTDAMVAAGITNYPAAEGCVNYTGGGYTDWYLPSENEHLLIYNNLANHAEFSERKASAEFAWSSVQDTFSSSRARHIRFSDGATGSRSKDDTTRRSRPVRRVAV